MRYSITAIFLVIMSCGQARIQLRSAALDAAIASQLDGTWDRGARLDLLRANMRSETLRESIGSVRRIAADGCRVKAQIKANARKWLAVKGFK